MSDYSSEIIDSKRKVLIDETGSRTVLFPRLLRTTEAAGRHFISGTNGIYNSFANPTSGQEETTIDSNFAPKTHRYVGSVVLASIVSLGIGLNLPGGAHDTNQNNLPPDSELSVHFS